MAWNKWSQFTNLFCHKIRHKIILKVIPFLLCQRFFNRIRETHTHPRCFCISVCSLVDGHSFVPSVSILQVPEPVQNGGYVPSQQSQSLGGVTDTNYNYQSHSPQQSPQQPPPQYMQNGYHSNGYVASHTGLLAPKFPPPQTFDSIPDINSSYSPSNYTAVSSNNNSQQQQQHLQSAPQQQFMNSNPMQGSHHSMPRHSNHNYFVTPSHPVSAYSGGMHPHHPHAQQGGMGVMHPGAGHYGLHRGALPGYSSHNGIHPPGGVLSRMHNGMMSASPTGSNNTSSPGRESGSEESSSDDSIHVSVAPTKLFYLVGGQPCQFCVKPHELQNPCLWQKFAWAILRHQSQRLTLHSPKIPAQLISTQLHLHKKG